MKLFNKKIGFTFLVISILGMSAVIHSEEDEGEEREEHDSRSSSRSLIKVPILVNPKFKAECSSCHMLYPAGLLPERSWTKMVSTLDKHFGEDASLDEATKKEILNYLVLNSSDHDNSRRGSKILKTISKADAPLRISETEYFKRKHHELSENVYKRKAIGSKANCLACHGGAENGNFNEHEVKIPKESDKPILVKKK
jgi:hypothetical protein